MQCLSVRLGSVSDNKMLKMQCLLVTVAMTACTHREVSFSGCSIVFGCH